MSVTSDSALVLSPDLLFGMHERMVRIRVFEERVHALAGAGEIPGQVHLGIGEEATYVGACMTMRPGDYQTGTHRSHGHALALGSEVDPLMAELYGKSTGICKGKGGSFHLADFSRGSLGETGIVGSSIPIAVGAALSAQVRGTDQVCLAFLGDGAVNEGIFHESVNLAGTWSLGVVFIIENNSYAVNTRTSDVTSGPNFAGLAAGYGIPGELVDGQDVLAVYEAVHASVARAARGDGPSIVECQTYRYTEHSGGLKHLPSYGWDQDLEAWKARDPIGILEARLLSEGHASREELDSTRARLVHEVDQAVEFAKRSPYPSPDEAYTENYGPDRVFGVGKTA